MTVPSLVRDLRRMGRFALARGMGRRLPFSVAFMLTHRCNFRCGHCNIPGTCTDELSTAEFRRAIDEFAAAGMVRASFSGGEALLRPDAAEIIAHAHALGLFTSLNTNGWFAQDRLVELQGVLDMVVFSFDGPQAMHDASRAQAGSHVRVLAGIAQARALGMAVATITLVTPESASCVDYVLQTAREMGFWCYFQPVQQNCFDRMAGIRSPADDAWLRDLARRLADARRHGLPVGNSTTWLDLLADGKGENACSTCVAGRYTATLLPDGSLVPCHMTSGDRVWPNGRDVGFAHAFEQMPAPLPKGGCMISPNRESTLLLQLRPASIAAALRTQRPPRASGAALGSGAP